VVFGLEKGETTPGGKTAEYVYWEVKTDGRTLGNIKKEIDYKHL
jgi:hypothetical protein